MSLTPPRTVEEFLALPKGGDFGVRIETRNGQTFRIPIAPDLVAFFVDDDVPLACVDADGVMWKLIRYADGRWARMRVSSEAWA